MKKLTDILFSTRLMSIVIVLFAVAMATATFVENDYGTQTAQALIYNTWWFEVLMLLLTINFIGNIFKYRLYRREKWPVFLFHIAFIITLFGAFVTRYFGYEGMMPIREGKVSNTILSDDTYVDVLVANEKEQKDLLSKKVIFGALSNNYFEIKNDFRGKEFSVKYVDLIPNAKLVFQEDKNQPAHIHIVVSTNKGREDLYIAENTATKYDTYIFSFNKPILGGMNFTKTTEELSFQSGLDGTYMEMESRKKTPVAKDSIATTQFKKLYRFANMGFVVMGKPVNGSMKYVNALANERKKFPYHALYLNVSSGDKTEQVMILGAKNATANPKMISLNDLNFTIKYGSREIKTPFSIKLRDFQLERYPGSNSPSSFASEVTVMDKDETFDYRIFMNHVLDYKGFRFFQASYDPDELGTHLSVNHDYWGTLLTYIGYFLMALGMFISFFWKGTRFSDLSKKLRKLSAKKLPIFILLFGITSMSFGQEQIPKEINDYIVNKEHAAKFGKLLIQDYQGRIKPINTYSIESLRKIYKKDSYKGLTAEQVILSAQLNPRAWSTQAVIHAKTQRLGNTMTSKLKIKEGLASIIHFYTSDNSYVINKEVDEAHQKKFMDRTATDKELINLDERANLWVQVLNGDMMRIYPKENDPNNKWFARTNTRAFVAQDTMLLKMHRMYMTSLQNALETNDYSKADEFLSYIASYQKKLGAAIIPSDRKVDLEIKYNKWGIFTKLMFYYMLIGFIFLILAFVDLFKPNSKIVNLLLKVFSFLTILGMAGHVFGLGLRWYISGHEPWSNGYEAVVFVAFITTLAGLIFSYRQSKFTIASTVLFASFLLSIAHGSMMSPEITNLVPVLKSYWLMIHVAIITASYGFLGLGSLLGFVVLLLYILRTPANAKRFNNTINELTYINESTITVGLYTLSIGTFLGGVWAAESWGRYWSWDPKEVWSLISMMVYIFVLHMRLVPGLKGKFAFNLATLFSIATLIMTFFGVNFYLSGMHSYATGDPVPVPNWIYFAIAFFVVFSFVSYWRYNKFKELRK